MKLTNSRITSNVNFLVKKDSINRGGRALTQIPRKGNGKGAWGGGGGEPPNIDEILNKASDFFKRFGGGPKQFLPIFIVLLILWLVVGGLYSVGISEQAVVQWFGKYHPPVQPPGLHWTLPRGISTITKIPVEVIQRQEFGFRSVQPGVRTRYATSSYKDESLMLTGDLNVMDVEWVVQFKIKDPFNYLFKIANPRETIRDVSESVTRLIVGDMTVNEVLQQRDQVATDIAQNLQNILDSYESGIFIDTVKLQDVNPPDPVKPSFNEVNEAIQEKEKLVNEAWSVYNKTIPKAKGEAEKVLREAEGYATERVNMARGDADRFIALWSEYTKAKDVTRRRMYLETLSEVLPKMGKKYIIDPQVKGLVPLFPIGEKGGAK